MHIAIILDGNRRYAQKNGFDKLKGHEFGKDKVIKLIDWSIELGLKELTLYAFSIENFNRLKIEVDKLMNLFRTTLDELFDDKRIDENQIKVNVIGDISKLNKEIQDRINKIENKTKVYDNFILNLAISYGGRDEIVNATKELCADLIDKKININEIDKETFSNYLYLKNSPDIEIRTGGDKRISNFLLWQIAYSELFFIDKFWPEIEKQDLINILDEFKKRERRFGK